MAVLCDFHRKKHKAGQSGPLTGPPPPVVIIFEDFEGFAPQILQDLFMSFRYMTLTHDNYK